MKTRITIALAATVLVGACAGNSDDAMQAAEGAAAASFRSPPDLDPILAPHIPRAAWRAIFKGP